MNAKIFLILCISLAFYGIGFSDFNYTFGYGEFDGYANITSGWAQNFNVILACNSANASVLVESFNHTAVTDNGFYSFSGVSDIYNSSIDSIACQVFSIEQGATNLTNDKFIYAVDPYIRTNYGLGHETNISYNNSGNAFFDFSSIYGKALSTDSEGVKNQSIMIKGNESFNYTVLTDDYGDYDFSGIPSFYYECDESQTFGCYYNVSIYMEGNFQKNFTINAQGLSGSTKPIGEEINLSYFLPAKVNGKFSPSSGNYGNITFFTYNASSYGHEINYCNYSINSAGYLPFNITNGKEFTANISFASSGQYNISVLCNTSLTTESLPANATYNIHLDGANIIINSPADGTVFSKNSAFNISLNAPAKSCSFGIIKNDTIVFMSGMVNATIQNYIYYAKNDSVLLSKITEGENNTAFFSCEDYYGITANKSVNFTADVTAPPAIDSFSAKLTNLGNIILTWNPVIDAKYYYIRKSQLTQIGRAFTFYANVSAPISNYEDLNVENYQTYYYEISPVDLYGNEGPVSHSLGIYAVSEQDYKKEIYDLISELGALQNQSLKEENELKEESELLIKALIIKNDLNYFQEFLGLLPINDIETINNIKYLMNNYESKSLDELKSMDYQISYNLNTYLNDYKKSNSIKTLNTTIKSLNITSIINESVLELNGKKYYKYVITNIISNPSPNLMKSVNLTFKVPSAAIIEGFENINSSINYSIKSLDSMGSQIMSFSFISLSEYDSSIAGQMIETAMPKSITAYQVLSESKNNIIINLIIWSLTLILSVSLLFQYKNYRINFKNRQNSN
jgi:hypothetical protein